MRTRSLAGQAGCGNWRWGCWWRDWQCGGTAIVTLGRSFSVNVAIHATQTMQKTGLFRIVRHPSYSGMMLIFIAVGVWTRNWVALAIFMVPPMVALLYRMNVEERALREAFGTEYEEYSRETKRLIPGVY